MYSLGYLCKQSRRTALVLRLFFCGSCRIWRRERDSNPRARERKLISSQPRYDHFDISPYMLSSVWSKTNYSIFIERGAPLCPARVPEIFCSLFASQNFDRCHSLCLASSATGSARQRPHFDISPYLTFKILKCIISYLFRFFNR